MTPEDISKALEQRFGADVVSTSMQARRPFVTVSAQRWPEIARFLRDDPRLGLNFLTSISALDLLADNKLACVYDLIRVSLDRGSELIRDTHTFAVRVEVSRDNPVIPTVSDVWAAADWHEREAYDLMGVRFEGHPDPRRILCPDDWEGHPLRKDYAFPMEYHGIPATTEFELSNPRH